MSTAPHRNTARITRWLTEDAFPFWHAHGVDRTGGGFHEVLNFDGTPATAEKRLRTMARQTYCFATASSYGWCDKAAADALVDHGLAFLTTTARTSDGGFAKTFAFDGTIIDETRDTYDYAFLVFASAAAAQNGNTDALKLGSEVFQMLEDEFYLGAGKGYREAADINEGERRANPHMHLLEAFTAWSKVSDDPRVAARAAEIVALFHDRFFDAETWSLREYMDFALAPVDGDRGAIREPGHHYEWAWLLHDIDRTGSPRTQWTARQLYASATAFGTNPITGLGYQAVSRHGEPLDTISRSWPQTEAVRAALTLKQTGTVQSAEDVENRVDLLFDRHITPAPTGCWFDRINADGAVASETAPASILYHMVSAFSAYLDDAQAT